MSLAADTLPGLGIECEAIVEQGSGLIGADELDILRDAEVSNVDFDEGGERGVAVLEGSTVQPVLIKSNGDWLLDSGFIAR